MHTKIFFKLNYNLKRLNYKNCTQLSESARQHSAHPTALARRSRPGSLQASSESSPVSEGRAPPYLSEHCIQVSSADTRRHLRSANRHTCSIPRFRLNTYYDRTPGVISCWRDGLELTPGFYQGSNEQHRLF